MTVLTKAKVVQVIGTRPIYKFDGDYFDWVYLGMRWLPNLKAGDVAVLPDHWATRDFVDFLTRSLLDHEPEIIWVPVRYLIDEGVVEAWPEIREELQNLVDDGAIFLPYDSTTPEFSKWFGLLENAKVIGETSTWGERYSTKRWLHPWSSDPTQMCLAQELGIPTAPGFNAVTTQELLAAYEMLGGGEVIIKPLRSSFGDGLVKLTGSDVQNQKTLKEYSFGFGPVAIESLLQIDQDELGEISWSTHYVGKQLFGPPTRQLVNGVTSEGNITPASLTDWQMAEILRVTRSMVDALSPTGIGGFNGPVVRGKPVVLDPNVGRITGVCPSLMFRELYCPEAVTLNRKLGKPTISAAEAWKRLQNSGIAFDRSKKTGVAIQGWIPSAWSQIICCGKNQEEVLLMFEEAKRLIS